MDNLLSYRFEDSVVIIRGFLNLDRFPYQEEISRAINGLPTEAPETILKEQDRKDIPTSPTLLPAMYNKINNQIRSPIQRAIDRFNEHHEEDLWELRNIRNDGCNHIIHSKKVPSSRRFAVQHHHHDSFGYRPDLLSCFVGLRDNTRLQVFNEFDNTWNEFTYHRGDIFLMRSHKAHRGTCYDDQDNSKVFFYIDTPEMLHTTDLHGKVFNVLNKDLAAWFHKQHAETTTERLLLTQATKKQRSLKRRRAKQNRANACRRRTLNTAQTGAPDHDLDDDQSQDSEDGDNDRAPLELNPEDDDLDDPEDMQKHAPTPSSCSSSSSSSSSAKAQKPEASEDCGPLSQESSLRTSATQAENTRRAYNATRRSHHMDIIKHHTSEVSENSDTDLPPRLRQRSSKDA